MRKENIMNVVSVIIKIFIVFIIAVFIIVMLCSWVEASVFRKKPRASKVHAYYRNRVMVLMYHHVTPDMRREGCITPQRLSKDLELLKLNGFNIIPVEQLAAFTDGKVEVPPNAVVITFDDGYDDIYLHAFPVLKKHQVSSVVFIIGGMVGQDGYLNWDQVRSMERSGLITFGGHTFNQHYRAPVSPYQKQPATVAWIYDEQSGHYETREDYLERMSGDCRLLQDVFMAELGHSTEYYAYPYGAYSPDYTSVLRDHGYKYIFTVMRGSNSRNQNPALYYRINAGTLRMPTDKLLASLKTPAVLDELSAEGQPVSWFPVWDNTILLSRNRNDRAAS